MAADLAVKTAQYDEIVKEKRTDVVKRFEDEIAVLRASEAALTDEVATFKVRTPHPRTPYLATPFLSYRVPVPPNDTDFFSLSSSSLTTLRAHRSLS